MAFETNIKQYDADLRSKTNETTVVSTGIPFWDLMFSFGKASQQVLSAFAPRLETGTRSNNGSLHRSASELEVIPVGEETLNVGTRRVAGETTRVRRMVVETPVEQDVSLREERVIVERRKPTGAASTATQAILTDTAVEMSDSFEVVDVWKSVRVTEEVVLRREVTERHETVRDIVRRDEVVVEQARRASSAPQHDWNAAAVPADRPEPAQIAADLKKVAERFEPKADQHEKATPRLDASAPKAEQRPAASQPFKTAEQAKGQAHAAQHDKASSSPKA